MLLSKGVAALDGQTGKRRWVVGELKGLWDFNEDGIPDLILEKGR